MAPALPSSSLLLPFLLLSAAATFAAADDTDINIFTHLHFFFHERVLGSPNSTVVASVDRAGGFGSVLVFDNELHEAADPSSPLIGRGQGIGVNTDLSGAGGSLTIIDFIFTAGEYNGSTLSLLGVRGASDRAIVGGSGRFRLVRGYAVSKVVSSTATTTTAEFDVYVRL